MMFAGKVLFYNKKSKFGFIKCHSDGLNYYVREKNLAKVIEVGDEVTFELKEVKRGKEAIQVKKIN